MNKANQAIQAALQRDWKTAVELNVQLIEENPTDTESLNRLAYGYTALGKAKDAKATYQKVLDIDPTNPIALKNSKRVVDMSKNTESSFPLDRDMFLEEIGKTKVITLVNVAPTKILRSIQIGQPLQLCIKRSKIFIQDNKKEFLGMLPDNISRRLINFIEGGNTYSVYAKSIEDQELHVFVKETKQATKFKNQTSFAIIGEKPSSFTISKKKSYDFEEDLEE